MRGSHDALNMHSVTDLPECITTASLTNALSTHILTSMVDTTFKRHDYVRIAGEYEEVSGTICAYCDGVANTKDHFIPVSQAVFLTNIPKALMILVPACRSCNSTAGAKLFPSIEAKREYIYQRFLERKPRKCLKQERSQRPTELQNASNAERALPVTGNGKHSAPIPAEQNTTSQSINSQDKSLLLDASWVNWEMALPATRRGRERVQSWSKYKQLKWISDFKEFCAENKIHLSDNAELERVLKRMFWELGTRREDYS